MNWTKQETEHKEQKQLHKINTKYGRKTEITFHYTA